MKSYEIKIRTKCMFLVDLNQVMVCTSVNCNHFNICALLKYLGIWEKVRSWPCTKMPVNIQMEIMYNYKISVSNINLWILNNDWRIVCGPDGTERSPCNKTCLKGACSDISYKQWNKNAINGQRYISLLMNGEQPWGIWKLNGRKGKCKIYSTCRSIAESACKKQFEVLLIILKIVFGCFKCYNQHRKNKYQSMIQYENAKGQDDLCRFSLELLCIPDYTGFLISGQISRMSEHILLV